MGPQCIYYRSQFLVASIFSGEKTPCFRKIYPNCLIANIRIIVKTANIVIIVIIANIVITANIGITGIIAITRITGTTAITRKLAPFYPSRTGQLPPASYRSLLGLCGEYDPYSPHDYRSPHKPQTFPILTSPKPRGFRRNSAQPRPRKTRCSPILSVVAGGSPFVRLGELSVVDFDDSPLDFCCLYCIL